VPPAAHATGQRALYQPRCRRAGPRRGRRPRHGLRPAPQPGWWPGV